MQFTLILKLRKTFKLISPPHTAPSSAPLLLLLLAEDREINTQKTNKYLKCFCFVFFKSQCDFIQRSESVQASRRSVCAYFCVSARSNLHISNSEEIPFSIAHTRRQ